MAEKNIQAVLDQLAQVLFDKKGTNILVLDIRTAATLTEYVVIAEGGADRHIIAQAESAVDTLENLGVPLAYQQGMKEGEWVVLDFSWLVVHLFTPGIRDKYSLEKLWPDSEIVDVSIDVFKQSPAALSHR